MRSPTLAKHLAWAICLSVLLPSYLTAQPGRGFYRVQAEEDSLTLIIGELKERVSELEHDVFLLRSQSSTTSILDESMVASRRGVGILPTRPTAGDPTPSELIPLPEAALLAGQAANALEISGFMDGVYEVNPRRGRENSAYLNQVEIDLARALNERAEVSVAVAYDESFAVGAATMSYAFRKVETEENGPSPLLSNWTATAGQFDVPFGLDYHKYASVDRLTVTQPAICSATHEGWNDVGMLNTMETRFGSLSAWVVKGLDSRVWDSQEEIPADIADDDPRWVDVPSQVSGGAQLNLSLISDLQAGISIARGWSEQRMPAFSLIGIHTQGGWKGFSVKAEAIRAVKAESIAPQVTRGYYVEALQAFDPVFVIGRMDQVEIQTNGTEHYYSAGGGVMVTEGLECRTEYQMQAGTDESRVMFQVVAGF